MSPSNHTFHLWIASDDSRTIVALAPLRVTRRPVKHEWGSITEVNALPPARVSSNIGGLIVLVALVPLCAATLLILGAPPLGILVLAVLVLAAGSASLLMKDPPSHVVSPDLVEFPDIHRVLDTPEERDDFLDLIELAEQAGRSLPALGAQADLVQAGQSLAEALWEAADVLSRRAQLRPHMDRQLRHPESAANITRSSGYYLAGQREKHRDMWEQVDNELVRVRTALEVAAVAGENAADDRDAMAAAREAYRDLAALYGSSS
ncbi:hypothetical protein AB0H57_10970 [Micromonospora sp. NPDC050686]|uniref:hypothetical protein n=1 Tax=Micromonospora sp. NPDC050686 TaxID=3154631 RepID=UPI0033DDCCFD